MATAPSTPHHYTETATALSVVTTRMAHDPAFADEFAKAAEGGNHETVRAVMQKAGLRISDTEVVIIPNGVCLCRGGFCICIVIRGK